MASSALRANGPIEWAVCRGRNGYDIPSMLPADMAAEAINVIFKQGALAQRPNGSFQVTASYGVPAYRIAPYVGDGVLVQRGEPFLFWSADDGVNPILVYRTISIVPTVPVPFSLVDPCGVGQAAAFSFAQLKGKMYVAYPSGVNRLHVWDMTGGGGTQFRRVGLGAPVAPVVANQGAGAYPATLRFYRVQWHSATLLTTGTIRSNLGTAVSFTPSGAGAAARITRPVVGAGADSGDSWTIFASTDNVTYYKLADLPFATTFYDDSAATSSYQTGALAPLEGANTPWPSVRYLLADGERLIGFGVYANAAGDAIAPVAGRAYFSPVIGTTDGSAFPLDDDERVSNTVASPAIQGWINIDIGGLGRETGIAGPVGDKIFFGTSKGLYALNRTGNAIQPFTREALTNRQINVLESSMHVGDDETGNPCLYFADLARGPYRWTPNAGLQYIGYDVFDLWQGNTFLFAAWHAADRSMWYWVTDGVAPRVLRFDTKLGVPTSEGRVQYGWSQLTGADVNCRHAVESDVFVGTNTSVLFGTKANANIVSDLDHAGQAYATASQLTSAPIRGLSYHVNKTIGRFYAMARAAAATLYLTLSRDFGLEPFTDNVSLAASAAETYVTRRFDNIKLREAGSFQITIGDADLSTPSAVNWLIDRVIFTLDQTGDER